MNEQMMRLNKFLSDAGVCSRREADKQAQAGHVLVNGKRAVPGQKVGKDDIVTYYGKKVLPEEKKVILLVNKPTGVVCTAQKKEKNNIIDFLQYPKRIYPIGRLDKDSHGLLLMTNNGDIVNKIMRAANKHEKEYYVTVNKDIRPDFINGISRGVPILDTVTRKCLVEQAGKRKFRIVLTQGLNRQIRRMCEYFGYRVVDLERIRIMNLELGELKSGTYREITKEEHTELMGMLEDSFNTPEKWRDSLSGNEIVKK